jgi:tRNA threonylcarbamoyladenosine biosynthesis protein TsaB
MSGTTFDNLLAIETSSTHLKLALSFGGDRLVKSDEEVERSHGQVIVRKIGNLLASSGLSPTDIQGLIVSTGPGSFTGLRIGLAAAKGMAVALNIPIVGVSLFEIAAWRLRSESGPVLVAAQVRREELLIGRIEQGKFELASVTAVPLVGLRQFIGTMPVIGLGPTAARNLEGVLEANSLAELEIDPADLILVGRTKFEAGELADLATLEPLYIQKSQAEIRFEQRRQQP